MPYITQERRNKIDTAIEILCHEMFCNELTEPGDLNYVLTRIINIVGITENYKYSDINNVLGVLECVKQEIYRRVAVPYEEYKKRTNGDVF